MEIYKNLSLEDLPNEQQKTKKWDYDSCYKLAKHCICKSDMKSKNDRAYNVARINGWFTDYDWFISTGELRHKPRPNRVKYTYEDARNIAIKYSQLSLFAKENRSLYAICNRKGWIKDFDWLGRVVDEFITSDNVYAYIFQDLNAIYIGRTISPKDRHLSHSTNLKSSVYRFCVEHCIDVPPMTILKNGLTIRKGLEYEAYYVKKYQDDGWNVLNISKVGVGSGSIGTMARKWNKKSCKNEALKYKTLYEFRKKSASAYNVAIKNDWVKDYLWLQQKVKSSGFWTYKKCFLEAKKYKSRKEFSNGCCSAYEKSLKNKWIDDYVWFRPSLTKKKWDYDYTYNTAKQYNKLSEFIKNHGRAYKVATDNNWLKDYTWLKKKDISKKVVEQYNLNGVYIATYNGCREASRSTGCTYSSIVNCCNGKFSQGNGYIWKYKQI